MAESVLDLQAKYEELMRIREEEAAAKEEQTQELLLTVAKLKESEAHTAKAQAENQEFMDQMTAYAEAQLAHSDTISRVLANEVVASREQALVGQANQAMDKKALKIAEGEFRQKSPTKCASSTQTWKEGRKENLLIPGSQQG